MSSSSDFHDFREIESRWQEHWERTGCHRSPQVPVGEKYFVHDATPFPNGPLHLGHVRCYVLGDMTARFQRLLGKCVLYYTGFDSFGLPIETEALRRGISPRELVTQTQKIQQAQFRALGLSYDFDRIADSSDPQTYRWTQWIFLKMLAAGMIERRNGTVLWCRACHSAVTRTQAVEGRCWRCDRELGTRRMVHWYAEVSRYVPEMLATLDSLKGWSRHARHALGAMLAESRRTSRGQGGGDWEISRKRSWGTPIPIVHCEACGTVAVPETDLPVALPEDLDWSVGPGALARCESFVHTDCPRCGGSAKRETDTLDGAFDDQWCYLQTLVLRGTPPGFSRGNLAAWLPVDRSQSGQDTYPWFHLYRFFGRFMRDEGWVEQPDFVAGFFGHAMVLAGNRKMSKHLGNAVSPRRILREHGADTLRVAMIWAAGLGRPVRWSDALLHKAEKFLARVYRTNLRAPARNEPRPSGPEPSGKEPSGNGPLGDLSSGGSPSRKAQNLRRNADATFGRVAELIEGFRPHAAVEALAQLATRLDVFTAARFEAGRLSDADAAVLRSAIDDFSIVLAPFAPHLAEELYARAGHRGGLKEARWPGGSAAVAACWPGDS